MAKNGLSSNSLVFYQEDSQLSVTLLKGSKQFQWRLFEFVEIRSKVCYSKLPSEESPFQPSASEADENSPPSAVLCTVLFPDWVWSPKIPRMVPIPQLHSEANVHIESHKFGTVCNCSRFSLDEKTPNNLQTSWPTNASLCTVIVPNLPGKLCDFLKCNIRI